MSSSMTLCKACGTPFPTSPSAQCPHCGASNAAPKAAAPVAQAPQAKPAQARPAEARPAQAQPVQATPLQAQPAQAQPVAAQPAQAQPAQAQPVAAQPAQVQPSRSPGVNISTEEGGVRGRITARKKKSALPLMIALAAVALVVVGGGLGALMFVIGGDGSPTIDPVGELAAVEHQPFTYTIPVQNRAKLGDRLRFRLVAGPPGASVNEATGEIQWTPSESQAPGKLEFTVEAAVGGAAAQQTFLIAVEEQPAAPEFAVIAPQVVREGEPLQLQLQASDPDIPASPLTYSLTGEPLGMTINPGTGAIQWTPSLADVGRPLSVTATVTRQSLSGGALNVASQPLPLEVQPADNPVSRWAAAVNARGGHFSAQPEDQHGELNAAVRRVHVDEEMIVVIRAGEDGVSKQRIAEMLPPGAPPATLFGEGQYAALYQGEDEALRTELASVFGRGAPVANIVAAAPTPSFNPTPIPSTPDLPTAPASGFTPEETAQLVALYDSGDLFSEKEYPTVRGIFAARFEREHQSDLEAAFGDDYQDMMDWLNDNVDLKEELFLAFDDQDNLQSGLKLFQEIKEAHPKDIVTYGNLAIALAVVWDNKGGVYNYARHQTRAKATMPDGHLDAAGNFDFFLRSARVMQGRGQWLPWEFLVHVIDHTTPQNEREWALQNYLPHRVMIGGCYKDVPYDDVMLNTQSEQARMNGATYNLPTLKQLGGVCAHQADYSSRIGKSLGVPAAYVRGQSNNGEFHAWVMWVEIKNVTKNSILFTLESYGRYRGDQYYVGDLQDPKSGEWITDRQLELRLQTVGLNPQGKRHTDRLMELLPLLEQEKELTPRDRFTYLNNVIEACPGCQAAWIELSKMAGDEFVKTDYRRQMAKTVDRLFVTFAQFPDFTLDLFDDLTEFAEDAKTRVGLYERLAAMYITAGRPDLGCEVRLKVTDLLLKEEQTTPAINGLAAMIKAFPNEGRYVPRMLDRLEAICANDESLTPQLLAFYNQFLPTIKQMRGDRPSKYCMDMFERAILRFRAAGQEQIAQGYAAQLAQIRAGKGRPDRG